MPYADPAKRREYHKAYRIKNNNDAKYKEKNRDTRLRRKYGISLEQRDQMLADQGGACAICRTTTPPKKVGWHTDHCHASGKVRGLLCFHCNSLLGYARDNPATCIAASIYLREHNAHGGQEAQAA